MLSSTQDMPINGTLDTRGRDMLANVATQPFFGAMGCTAAIVFTCLGASYGTAKSGVGIAAMGVLRPDLIVKSTRPTPIPAELPASPLPGSAAGLSPPGMLTSHPQTLSPSLWPVSSASTASSSLS